MKGFLGLMAGLALGALMIFAVNCGRPAKAPPVRKIVATMQSVTVKLETAKSWGTGVVVDCPDGVCVLTAKHVAEDSDDITASWESADGVTSSCKLTVLRTSAVADLALLGGGAFQHKVTLGSGLPRVGDDVYHYGSCFGALSYMQGWVSRLHDVIEGADHVQFTDIACPGSSGGGVFAWDGKLLGIMSRANPGQLAWAVPVDAVRAFLDGTEKKPEVPAPPPPEEEKPATPEPAEPKTKDNPDDGKNDQARIQAAFRNRGSGKIGQVRPGGNGAFQGRAFRDLPRRLRGGAFLPLVPGNPPAFGR